MIYDDTNNIGVTSEIIVDLYLRYLGRMPESNSVIQDKIRFRSIKELEVEFSKSPEYIKLSEKYDIYTIADLHKFIDAIDYLGGWGSPKAKLLIDRFRFHKYQINEELDPFSDEYMQEQLKFYELLTGYLPDQNKTELTKFNIENHIHSANPYAHHSAHIAAMHSSRLSLVINQSCLGINSRVLDMGCGWGFSSELMAYLGLDVVGIDINPLFCDLINRRAAARDLSIIAKQGTFEDIPIKDYFDAVLYYECLHHAIRPWVALQKSYERLNDGGKLLLAGEPVNSMWKNWGLRLDAESLYVIKKFGWFESGWSMDFIEKCILMVGYKSIEKAFYGNQIGWIITATK
jgi:2-polyprenyl-3-methyl-5-hydroxy-6-metoxy-1,4-benzoquinol methylase